MFVLQISIQKDEVCTVRDNSNKLRWKVTNSRGQQGEAPGAMFLLTPPDQEAIDTAEKLKRHYDRVITLWQKKHLRMRQNMIFATIKVVKSWDFQQYISMEKEQRIAIRRALNEDSDKLIQVCFKGLALHGTHYHRRKSTQREGMYLRNKIVSNVYSCLTGGAIPSSRELPLPNVPNN